MPKKFIKRYLPDSHTIRSHKHLKIFGRLLHDPNLWHLNRRSVTGAVTVGLFAAFIPVPFQMVIAAAFAIPARVNLPIAAALVWVTNPLTMPPLFYFAYKLGTWVLSLPPRPFHFELSFAWLSDQLHMVWRPFLFGCFILGVSSAAAGNLLVRAAWRVHVLRYLKKRSLRIQDKVNEQP